MSAELSRRSAVRGVAVLAAGAVAGFAVGRTSSAAHRASGTTAANAYGPATSTAGRRPLAAADSIPQGGGRIITDPAIVLVRGGGGQVHAFSAICTHQGCAVTRIADGTIDCPCHGSRFDLRTGAVVAGPAPRPLPSVAVVVRNGEVYQA